MSYVRQFHIAGAAQRKALDPILVRDEHGSNCLSSTKDLSASPTIFLVIRDLIYGGSPDSRSLCVKVTILSSISHLIASQWSSCTVLEMLMCPQPIYDKANERALQTLKPRNVLNRDPHEGRVCVIEETGDERTCNVFGVVCVRLGLTWRSLRIW